MTGTFADKHFVFLAGLHRSGTSLLHEILRSHPETSGFANTGVPEDEGQHLQTVYPAAKVFGGPGRFGFNEDSFMDERHPLASAASASKLKQEWGRHWDLSKSYLLEKSPPNLVRTRFLQALFPGASFIVILRHPIAVAYATEKWTGMRIGRLIEHTLLCYERFFQDLAHLKRVYLIRYEEFVVEPTVHIDRITRWLRLQSFAFQQQVRSDVNARYFANWAKDSSSLFARAFRNGPELPGLYRRYEQRANACGYSLAKPTKLLSVGWRGTAGHPTARETEEARL